MADDAGTYVKGNETREAVDDAQAAQLRWQGFKKKTTKAAAKAADKS